jgi:hypothetical protein
MAVHTADEFTLTSLSNPVADNGDPLKNITMLRPLALQISSPGIAPLSPEQKRFNQLLAKIEKARTRLAAWQEHMPLFAQAHAHRVAPLEAALMVERRAWLNELDAASAQTGWTRAERETLSETILDLAAMLIEITTDENDIPALKALYNKHSSLDFDSEAQQELQAMKGLLEAVSGLDLGDDDVASEDELMQRAQAQMHARHRQADQPPGHGAEDPAGAGRKGSARRPSKAQLKRDEEARDVTQTVREVFRKLASALHPDRATHDADRSARTVMMQRVNRAYESNDLLALLELQLEIEQVDSDHIANAPAPRIRHFNKLLAEQLQELEQEIEDTEARFCDQYLVIDERRLDPAKLVRVLDDAVRDLHVAQSVLGRDRKMLLDKASARRWLKRRRQEMRYEAMGDFRF